MHELTKSSLFAEKSTETQTVTYSSNNLHVTQLNKQSIVNNLRMSYKQSAVNYGVINKKKDFSCLKSFLNKQKTKY